MVDKVQKPERKKDKTKSGPLLTVLLFYSGCLNPVYLNTKAALQIITKHFTRAAVTSASEHVPISSATQTHLHWFCCASKWHLLNFLMKCFERTQCIFHVFLSATHIEEHNLEDSAWFQAVTLSTCAKFIIQDLTAL